MGEEHLSKPIHDHDGAPAWYTNALQRSMSDLIVPKRRAERLFEIRQRRLNIFSDSDTPDELRKQYEAAVQLTQSCHRLSESFIGVVEMMGSFGSYSPSDLFTLSRFRLDKLRASSDGMISTKNLKIRSMVLQAVVDEIKSPTGLNTFGDIVELKFAQLPIECKIIAQLELQLLVSTRNTLTVILGMCGHLGQIMLICRGIFYRTIVEDQGKLLENNAAKRAVHEKLTELPLEAVAHVPGIAEFVAPLKVVLELTLPLASKEAALKRMKKQLSERYTIAADFVNSYTIALLEWANWATSLNKCALGFIKDFQDAISADVVASSQ